MCKSKGEESAREKGDERAAVKELVEAADAKASSIFQLFIHFMKPFFFCLFVTSFHFIFSFSFVVLIFLVQISFTDSVLFELIY